MELLQQQLFIKRSQIPDAGKGLFTKLPIKKGIFIIEYKGRMTTWKEVQQGKIFNGYVYYISRNKVIDALPYKKALARYANDARGITKITGVRNNCIYELNKGKVFIKALRHIKAGEEILVSYGKEYWDVIRFNKKLEEKEKNSNS